jgi:hypothetical protein
MQRQVTRAGCNIARHNRPPPRLKERPSRAEVAKTRRIWLTIVRAGESRTLVVAGEPGVGKTALLDLVAAHASGLRVVRASGVQSEMELAFAGLSQLLAPILDRLERVPRPQREALQTAFGISSGQAPDRFLVGIGRPELAVAGGGRATFGLPGR